MTKQPKLDKNQKNEQRDQLVNFLSHCLNAVGVPSDSAKELIESYLSGMLKYVSHPHSDLMNFPVPDTDFIIPFSKIPELILSEYKVKYAPLWFTWEVEQHQQKLALQLISERKRVESIDNSKPKKKKLISFNQETIDYLDQLAAELDISFSALIRLAVDDYINTRS